jgi:hypothetical protein
MRIRWAILAIVSGLGVLGAGAEVKAQAPSPAPSQESAPEATQTDITSDIELTRAAIQVRRQALVTAAMDLGPKEAEAFWPLYRDYRSDMSKVNDQYVNLLVAYAENYDTLSDKFAAKALRQYLDIEKGRTAVKARYLPRFEKVLPARKVMRFFQVDNKLDAIINAELAAEIPLAR